MTDPDLSENSLTRSGATSREYPKVELTEQMISAAKAMVKAVKVNRTIASKIDTLAGILGEIAWHRNSDAA